MERAQKIKMNNGKNQRRTAPKPTNVWGNFYNLFTPASLRSYIGKKQQTNPFLMLTICSLRCEQTKIKTKNTNIYSILNQSNLKGVNK